MELYRPVEILYGQRVPALQLVKVSPQQEGNPGLRVVIQRRVVFSQGSFEISIIEILIAAQHMLD